MNILVEIILFGMSVAAIWVLINLSVKSYKTWQKNKTEKTATSVVRWATVLLVVTVVIILVWYEHLKPWS